MTDEEAMAAICNADKEAYQYLVSKHFKAISHYAFRILGNSKDTEDITQETFLRLWLKADKWQAHKASLSTWLHRITHNLCIDYLRKDKSAISDDIDAQASEGKIATEEELASYSGGDIEVSFDKKQKLEALQTALNQLPINQRNALTLCHYQGFSNKEAAVIMDVSHKAIESLIIRAKKTLRDKLLTT
ncbi:MAG: RNA polymerase [SAR86 cluster bacterium]|uniref:RNA polymerase n=1 Tax=SAR86 cluster bacterium TaxID=2030880 RepID=A0A2A4MNK7_9GAMM|nr:MAG: RNA polymerase [SAR86 cluster bacterium]